MGLRPGGGLRPVVINRRYGKTCSVRQELLGVRAGHCYEPAGTLRAAGRQPLYIKGRPGGGLGTSKTKSVTRQDGLAPGRRNPNQYNLDWM